MNGDMLSILANIDLLLIILLPIAALIIGLIVGYIINARIVKSKIGSATQTADKIIKDANLEAKTIKKEAILEAKEEVHKLRADFDREVKERRNELQRMESRILQKEEYLDKKKETIEKKLEALEQTSKNLALKEQELNRAYEQVKETEAKIVEELERVASMTKEEAKAMLISQYEQEAKKDAAVLVRNIEQQAKEEADKKAKEIISLAIQRCAVEHTAEVTVSVVPLPNDEMKGRIIGREGRNIRALESATGIDLIIDDTPEAVILSGFDPVRREVARIALEKLIADGRIHPARIEEVVEKVKKEVENHIKEAGENAVFETGVYGIHPELVKLLGRLQYRTSYGQNILKHSIEVSHIAGLLAAELGLDVMVCKRAGLLHDIGKAVDHDVEGTHIS
ncbi:MAG TPA: ribonuclease Y, partial [Clostridia bacterium]